MCSVLKDRSSDSGEHSQTKSVDAMPERSGG